MHVSTQLDHSTNRAHNHGGTGTVPPFGELAVAFDTNAACGIAVVKLFSQTT